MKTLLLTSVTALIVGCAGPSAFADHRNQDGQERFAYDGNLYGNVYQPQYNGWYTPNQYTPNPIQPVQYNPVQYNPVQYNPIPVNNPGLNTQPYYGQWNTNSGYPVNYNPAYPANICPVHGAACPQGCVNCQPQVQVQRQPVMNNCGYNGRQVIRPVSGTSTWRTPRILTGFGGF